MTASRNEVLELIATAIAELRDVALPRDLAQLRELELDATDAESEEQLQGIAQQAHNLRTFCQGRKKSADSVRPPSLKRQ